MPNNYFDIPILFTRTEVPCDCENSDVQQWPILQLACGNSHVLCACSLPNTQLFLQAIYTSHEMFLK